MGFIQMSLRPRWIVCFILWIACTGIALLQPIAAADSDTVEASAEAFVKAFNDAKSDAIVSMFLPEGELVDEEGNLYQGKEQLTELFSAYFAQFPGAILQLTIESTRLIGDDIAIEEGTRYISTKEDVTGQVRYVALRTKKNGKWYIASLREFYDQPEPTPGERLAPLAWMEGDWISEDPETVVRIAYRWTEDHNFLIGDFSITSGAAVTMKTTQRIGWDPRTGTVRSWVFDSDGGFAEGSWSQVGNSWVIKSTATLPDASTGTATVELTPVGENRFRMVGRDRTANGGLLEDFDVTVTRAPPTPATSSAEPTTTPKN